MTMVTTATQQSISSKQCNRLEVDYLALGWFFCFFLFLFPWCHTHCICMAMPWVSSSSKSDCCLFFVSTVGPTKFDCYVLFFCLHFLWLTHMAMLHRLIVLFCFCSGTDREKNVAHRLIFLFFCLQPCCTGWLFCFVSEVGLTEKEKCCTQVIDFDCYLPTQVLLLVDCNNDLLLQDSMIHCCLVLNASSDDDFYDDWLLPLINLIIAFVIQKNKMQVLLKKNKDH